MQRGQSPSTLSKLAALVVRVAKAIFSASKSPTSFEAKRRERLADLSPFSKRPSHTTTKRSVTVAELRPSHPEIKSPPQEDLSSITSAAGSPQTTINAEEISAKTPAAKVKEDICPNCASEKHLVWFYTIAIDLSAVVTLAPAYLLLIVAGYYLSLSWAEGLSFALLFTVPLLINFSKRALCERCGAQIDSQNGSKSENADQNPSS